VEEASCPGLAVEEEACVKNGFKIKEILQENVDGRGGLGVEGEGGVTKQRNGGSDWAEMMVLVAKRGWRGGGGGGVVGRRCGASSWVWP